MRKGVIFTVLTLFFALTVLTLALYYSVQTQQPDISAEKMRTIFDDAEGDMKDILLVDSEVTYDDEGSLVTFMDTFPQENGSTMVGGYGDFIHSYGSMWNAQVEFYPGTPAFNIIPTGLIYDYPSFNKGEIRVYNASGDGMVDYDLYVFADLDFVNVTEDTTGGPMTVRLNATFPNGGYMTSYTLARDSISTLTINLRDATVVIRAGNNSIGGLERNGSLIIRKTGNVNPYVETRIRFPPDMEVGVRSNSKLTVKDILERSDYLWLTPQIMASSNITTPPTPPTTTTTTPTTSSTTTTSTTSTSTTTTTTTTSTSTTSTTLMTCDTYCKPPPPPATSYSSGTCRQNAAQCGNNGEVHEAGGDVYCAGGPSQDTCCCAP